MFISDSSFQFVYPSSFSDSVPAGSLGFGALTDGFYVKDSSGLSSRILMVKDRRDTVRASGLTDDSLVTETGIRAAIQASPAAGSNTQVQYNNSGVLGASSSLTFTTSTNTLRVSTSDHIVDILPTMISLADVSTTLGQLDSLQLSVHCSSTTFYTSIIAAASADIINLLGFSVNESTYVGNIAIGYNTGIWPYAIAVSIYSDKTAYVVVDGSTTYKIALNAATSISGVLYSSLSSGAPISVTSTTVCTNLNADLLDGYHASSFALSGSAITIANQADNRIITATATSNALNAESNFTFSPTSRLYIFAPVVQHFTDGMGGDATQSWNLAETNNYGYRLWVKRSRGTQASPSAALDGDLLFSVLVAGYPDTGTISASWITQAEDTFTGSVRGSSMYWQTTIEGGATLATRLEITKTGAIKFNNAYTFPTSDGSANYILKTNGSGVVSWVADSSGSGTVTSVAMTVPTGLSVSGTPITTSGTLAVTLTSGYVIPTTTEQTNWNALVSSQWATVSDGLSHTASFARLMLTLNNTDTTYGGVAFKLITAYPANTGDYFLFNFRGDYSDMVQICYDASTSSSIEACKFEYLTKRFFLSNSAVIVDGVNNRMGLGLSPNLPTTTLEIKHSLQAREAALFECYQGTATAPSMIFRHARGLSTTASASLSGDYIGGFGFRGYGATAFATEDRGIISCAASENWTDLAMGTDLAISLTANKSRSTRAVFYARGNGNVGVGSTFGSSLFQVDQQTTSCGGTVSTTAGSAVVTGSGTQFLNTFIKGDAIVIGTETKSVLSVASDTQLTLTTNMTNSNSSVTYSLTGGTRFAVKGNGDVGIGTASPSVLMDVVNTNTQKTAIIQVYNNGGTGGAAFSMKDSTTGLWQFKVVGTLGDFKIRDNITGTDVVYFEKAAPANSIFVKTSTGYLGLGRSSGIDSRISLAEATTAAGGILFGTDVNLYRASANNLKSDDVITASNLVSENDLTASITGSLYIGTRNATGSWQITISGANLIISKHDGSSYVVKQTVNG